MSREASDACATHGAFGEALECGSDRATALEGSGKAIVAQLSLSSRAAGPHDSAALPKRRLDAARTPKCCARNGRHILTLSQRDGALAFSPAPFVVFYG